MNQIYIRSSEESEKGNESNESVFSVVQAQANKIIPLLRSDYFSKITIGSYQKIDPKQLKYLAQITRLLKEDGQVVLQKQESQVIQRLLKNIGLLKTTNSENQQIFRKNIKNEQNQKKSQSKLSIGFKSLTAENKIDEEQLLKDQGIEIKKKKIQNCDDKPKACANCSCGRKNNQKAPTKEELVESVNSGKALTGCGKCFEGDSARCGSCPYRGLPAFKPGDKLKLAEDGNLIVEEGKVVVSGGKIKLQL